MTILNGKFLKRWYTDNFEREINNNNQRINENMTCGYRSEEIKYCPVYLFAIFFLYFYFAS